MREICKSNAWFILLVFSILIFLLPGVKALGCCIGTLSTDFCQPDVSGTCPDQGTYDARDCSEITTCTETSCCCDANNVPVNANNPIPIPTASCTQTYYTTASRTIPPQSGSQNCALACGAITGTHTYNVSGVVKNASGSPVQGASVNNGATTTQSDGSFTLINFAAGNYILTSSFNACENTANITVVNTNIQGIVINLTCAPITPAGVYSITGIVKDAAGTPQKDVMLSAVGQITRATNTSQTILDGTFSIGGLGDDIYTITATTDTCTGTGEATIDGASATVTITLNCIVLPKYLCTQWSTCINGQESRTCLSCDASGVDCVNYNQTTHELVESMNYPLLLKPCNTPDPNICSANRTTNVLNPGEECYKSANSSLNNVGSCGSIDNCNPDTCRCLSSFCNNNGILEPGETCACSDAAGAPQCQTSCDTTKPTQLTLTEVPSAISLSWTPNPTCVKDINIQRCVNTSNALTGCTNITTQQANATPFVDSTGITPDKYYCYKTFTNYSMNGNIVESNYSCIVTGNALCFTNFISQPICYASPNSQTTDSIAVCGSDWHLNTTVCANSTNPNSFCTYQSGVPVCKPQSTCDACNGPFRFFAGLDFFFNFSTLPWQCSRLQSDLTQCYKDVPKTESVVTSMSPVDIYKDCSTVRSCYDYRSKSTCTNDPCAKANDDCSWISYNDEANLGVCIPKNITNQNCNACSDKPLFFSCTSDTCPLYGNQCYYTQINRQNQCIGTGTNIPMGCTYYNTQNDCIAANGTAHSAELLPNNALNKSNDKFGFGTCNWDSNACIKDANNDTVDDCGPNSVGGFVDYIKIPSHSSLIPDLYKKCISDNTPPNTILLTNQTTFGRSLQGLDYYATDNAFAFSKDLTETQIKTRFALLCNIKVINGRTNKTNPPVNPPTGNVVIGNTLVSSTDSATSGTGSGTLNSPPDTLTGTPTALEMCNPSDSTGFVALATLQNQVHTPGSYTLQYYSEDLGGNREIIQEKQINILGDFQINNIQHTIDKGTLSNVTLTFGTSRPTYCAITLTKANAFNYTLPSYTLRTFYNLTFTGLSGGLYSFSITCNDNYATVTANNISFTLDVNEGITNVDPQDGSPRAIKTQTVTLTTNQTASCRMSKETTKYSEMQLNMTASADKKTHNYTLTNLADGVYWYYTACDFGSNMIIQGLYEDAAYFTIDTTPPITTLLDDNKVSAYLSEKQDNVSLSFSCEDIATLDSLNQDHAFGCDYVNYVLNTDGIERQLNYTNGHTSSIQLSYQQYPTNKGPTITYYSVDRGGNRETSKTIHILLGPIRNIGVSITYG